MKRVAAAVVLTVVLVAPGAAATGSVWNTTACTWQHALSVPGGWFNDVAFARESVWAVGYTTPRGSNKAYPLVATWDGSTWSTAVGKGYGQHEDVLGGPTDEVWITGLRNGKPVLHRFDGRAWTTHRRDVAFANAQRSRSVWLREGRELVGLDTNGGEQRLEAPASIAEIGPFAADADGRLWVDDGELERFHMWNGQRWSQRRYPRSVSAIYEMASGRSNTAWAVGNEVARWDGVRWTHVPVGGEDQVLHDVDALRVKALAVGQDWGRWNRHGAIAEWDGARWHTSYYGRRSSSNPSDCPACDISTVEVFNGVAFATGREAWAVGYGDAGADRKGVVYRGRCG